MCGGVVEGVDAVECGRILFGGECECAESAFVSRFTRFDVFYTDDSVDGVSGAKAFNEARDTGVNDDEVLEGHVDGPEAAAVFDAGKLRNERLGASCYGIEWGDDVYDGLTLFGIEGFDFFSGDSGADDAEEWLNDGESPLRKSCTRSFEFDRGLHAVKSNCGIGYPPVINAWANWKIAWVLLIQL